MQNSQKNKKQKKASKGLNLLYQLTHYHSYNSYRQRLMIVRSTLWIAAFLWIVRGFVSEFASMFIINNVVIFLLGIYLIGTYLVTAKAAIMFKDSATVMNSIAFEGGVTPKSWHIYDGALENLEKNEYSVEVSFFKERAFLTSFTDILRKKEPTLPLSKTDILNLKDYVEILNAFKTEEKAFQVYATIDDEMAKALSSCGFELYKLSNHYRNKPFRWDYARTTGRIRDVFWNYPKHWTACVLVVPSNKK